jgi:uncharacterized phiE125 gp8 family phage protein
MALRLLIPPVAEPVTLDHLRAHLRVSHDAEDQLIRSYAVSAREYFERIGNRAILAQTWQLSLDGWPREIRLPRPPLQTVLSIAYRDAQHVTRTLAADQYHVDAESEPARICPAVDVVWPTVEDSANAITIRYIAGFATPVAVNVSTNVFSAPGRNFTAGEEISFSVVAEDLGLPPPLSLASLYFVVNPVGSTFQVAMTENGTPVDVTGPSMGQLFVGRIPEGIRNYIKLMVSHAYEHREPVVLDSSVHVLPLAAESLFQAHRILEVA